MCIHVLQAKPCQKSVSRGFLEDHWGCARWCLMLPATLKAFFEWKGTLYHCIQRRPISMTFNLCFPSMVELELMETSIQEDALSRLNQHLDNANLPQLLEIKQGKDALKHCQNSLAVLSSFLSLDIAWWRFPLKGNDEILGLQAHT